MKHRKQCVRVNNVCSDFKDIISGVHQGSVVGPMLFNAFLSDFLFSIREASVHNFADDNMLSSFAKYVTLLMEILMAESPNAIKWFSENKMIVNPDKFKSIIIQTSNQTSKPKQFLIGNDVVEKALHRLSYYKYTKMTNLASSCISVTFVNLLPSNLMLL